jgi:hypothetical protein
MLSGTPDSLGKNLEDNYPAMDSLKFLLNSVFLSLTLITTVDAALGDHG